MEISFEEKCEWSRRYSRQILVPQLNGINGQYNLSRSKVIIIGAGGIGSTVILYLAGAGIGRLDILDYDIVEESNLHRQIIHIEEGSKLKEYKAESACKRIKLLNSNIQTKAIITKLTYLNAIEIFQEYDVIIDATDNYEARYSINDACVQLKKPLISGSAVGMEGQVTVFPCDKVSPCYRCVYPQPSFAESCRSCANAGVLGPVPGLIGSLQAIETIKLLTRLDQNNITGVSLLIGKQVYYDGIFGEFHTFTLPPRKKTCISCGDDVINNQELIAPPSINLNPTGLPSLDDNYRISTTNYHNILQSGMKHILLDVRSELQFQMISLPIEKYNTIDLNSINYVNIPYSNLKNNSKIHQDNLQSKVLSVAEINEESGENIHPIYVLCRRGNDSVRATSYLLELFPKLKIFNINGGLSSWSIEVDSTIPQY